MLIREFQTNDLKRVHEIESMSFSDPYDINILKQLYDIGAGFLVAQEEGYVVGYIIFWIKYENQGHIISLAVDKDYQNKNIGFKLLKRAIDIFRNFNIFIIKLEVKSKNRNAIEFYRKFGFKEERVIFNYYEDGSDAIAMVFDYKF
jgi:ribosomal-protein-alanine N-acetyltransferase